MSNEPKHGLFQRYTFAQMTMRFRTVLCTVLTACVLTLAACAPQVTMPQEADSATRVSVDASPTSDGFVGNDACQACHADEFQKHQNTRHMKTLFAGTKSAMGSLAPPVGGVANGGTVLYDEDQLIIEAPNKNTGAPVPIPIDLVLGSGKTGMTFLAVHPGGSVEIRQSWFPAQKCWRITPGQEDFSNKTIGQTHSVPDALRCIGCHAVARPDGDLIPEPRFFGVGCEACHGPGAEHVTAMKSSDKTRGLYIKQFTQLGGSAINAACGTCHRTPEAVAKLDKLSQKATNRFQPYGLSLSKCFIKSNDKLSCITCHNPHEDASKDTAGYIKTCISCHSAPQKVCPVNAQTNCITCHMPTKPVFPGTPFPVEMADHFIRIHPQK